MAAQKIEKLNGGEIGTKPTMKAVPLNYTKDDNGHFICPQDGCKFTSKNQSTMHYHMKKHLEELNYVCKKCSKAFLQKQGLDLHIRSKHPEVKDSKRIKCPYDNCEFSALTKGNTIIHCLRVHFQEEVKNLMDQDNETKTITCNECYNEFGSSSAFMYHCKKCIQLDDQNEKHEILKDLIHVG